MSKYRVRLPISKTDRGQIRSEGIERIEVERASSVGFLIEGTNELPRAVPGQMFYFYSVPGYDDGLYYYNGTQWIQLDNTSIDVQAFTIDGTGNVWDDLNVMNFTGQTDAQPDGTVLIDTQIFVTFYHNTQSWAWGGPRPVYVGAGGDHVAVESDLIPLGVANLVTSVHGRTGDVVGQTGDYTYDQVGADPAGSAAAVQANLDTHEAAYNPHAKVTWKGPWQGGQYVIHDMVTDNGWLSIANKTTTERSSPQALGDPFWLLDTADPNWTQNDPTGNFVISGNVFTTGSAGYLTGYRYYIPSISATMRYTLIIQDVTDPLNIIDLQIISLDPPAVGWFDSTVAPALVPAGISLRIGLYSEDTASEVTINANYDYSSDNNDVTPLTGEAHRRLNRSYVRFHKTDADSNAGALDAVPVGATITVTGFSSWEIVGIADGGAYWEYTIIGTGDPLPGVRQFTFTYPLAATPQEYWVNPGYWTANPPTVGSITGYLNLSGVVTTPNDAFAAEIQFQDAYIPTDWDQIASSSAGGGGGSGGGGEINAGVNVGAGIGEVYRDKTDTNLNFKTIASADASVIIVNNADDVDLQVTPYTGANVGTGVDVYKDTTSNSHNFKRLRSADGSISFTEWTNDIDMKAVSTSKKIVNGSIRNPNIHPVTPSGWDEYQLVTGWVTRNMINCRQPPGNEYRMEISTTGNFYGTVTISLTAGLYGGVTAMSEFVLLINGSTSPASSSPRIAIDHNLVNQSSSNFIRYPVTLVTPVYNVSSTSEFSIGYSGSDLEDIAHATIILDLREI